MTHVQIWNHHKCATGFMTHVLQRLAIDNNLTFVMDHRGDIDIAQMQASADILHIKNAHAGLLNAPDVGGVHIVRNPFAVVVSGYFSHRATHAIKLNTGVWDKLAAQRERLLTLDKTQGLWATIEFLLDPEFFPGTPGPLHALNGWPHEDPRFVPLRMEDFVRQPGTNLMQALTQAGADVERLSAPKDEDFTFEKISGGRQIGAVDETSHYRSGDPNDWRVHLEPEHISEIQNRCRTVFERHYPELLYIPRPIVPGTALEPPVAPDPAVDMATVQIGNISLSYRNADGGGRHYLQRGHSEEYHSRIYPILRETVEPKYAIDIGANYGYTGLLMRRAFPACHLTLVEPIPWLANYIRYNFHQNDVAFDRFESAICSDTRGGARSTFGVRSRGTQDSRVILQPGMEEIETAVVTLDDLAANIPDDAGVYIKIDTQGWEERVFAGGEAFLTSHHGWFAKTEFAPQWLESQGSDPVQLLRWLMDRFDVFESAGRVQATSQYLSDVLGTPLKPGIEEDFVRYTRNLALNDKGWVDLYILPPSATRRYSLEMFSRLVL